MLKKFKRRTRDFAFLGLFLLSVFTALKASSDTLPFWLQGTLISSWLSQFSVGNQNIHDIAAGVLVSFAFYFLVVWLPERDKRKRVRLNLQRQYDSFREKCIAIFLMAMSGSYDPAEIDSLNSQSQFKKYFEKQFSITQTRWDAVSNGLEENRENIHSLSIEFDIFIADLRFSTSLIDTDNEAFVFLRELSDALYRAKNCSPGYDDVKSLLKLMWRIFTGWSFIDGYPKKDLISETIEGIT